MELNITSFFNFADPFEFAASVAERGENAGAVTWKAANNADFQILQNDDQRTAFRSFVRGSGGWSDAEINAWSDGELNALAVQWISGDLREPVGFELGPDCTPEQWADYEAQCEAGQCAGRIYKGADGEIYFNIEA